MLIMRMDMMITVKMHPIDDDISDDSDDGDDDHAVIVITSDNINDI